MPATEQTKQETATIEFLNKIDGEAEAAKDLVSRHWQNNMDLVRGDAGWSGTRPPIFRMNMLANQVNRKVARVTESKPTFSVGTRLGELSQMAKVLDQTCRAILEANELPLVMERVARFGMQTGVGFFYIPWDREAEQGAGDVRIICLDPRSVYIDPSVVESKDVAKRAQYIRVDHVMSLQEIRQHWPGRGALVKPDLRYSRFQNAGAAKRGLISAALNIWPRVFRTSEPSLEGPIPRAVVKDYYLRDPDTDKWPGGRHIIRSGDIILQDSPNPYWDGEWPIEMVDWQMDLDHPWGMDEVRDLQKLQESEDRLGDAIMRNALHNSQSWVIADHDALDTEAWRKITGEGGIIVKKRPTREFRRDPPPALPGYMFQMLTQIPQFADFLTGNADGGPGRASRSPLEAVTDGLQSQGNPLARMIARRFESAIARVGQKVISRVIQFYTTDRMLTYYDLNGHLINYLFQVQSLRKLDDGRLLNIDEMPLQSLSTKFRFVVQPYSSMAMTKMQRAQVGIGLWQASAGRGYPFRRVLEMADVGDPDELMQEATREQQSGVVPPPAPPAKR